MKKSLCKKIGIGVGILAILAAIAGATFYLWPQHTAPLLETLELGGVEQTVQEYLGIYTSNEKNVRFDIPDGWERVEAGHVPLNFSKTYIVLAKKDSSCRVAFGGVSDESWKEYSQASHGTRIFSKTWQFDTMWDAPSQVAKPVEYSGEGRQYLPGEILSASINNREEAEFILWSEDGAAVPDECAADFYTLLATAIPYYEPVTLTKQSEGTMRIDNDSVDADTNDRITHILFTPKGTKENFVVSALPEGASPYEETYVGGGYIYFLSNKYSFNEEQQAPRFDSAIYRLNPLTKEMSIVEGARFDDSYISSFYLKDNVLYFMVGESDLANCLERYRLDCKALFYSLPAAGGHATLLGTDLPAGYIAGFNNSEQLFYLSRGWGDAGCFSFAMTKFSLMNGAQGTTKGGTCADDPAYESEHAVYDSLMQKARADETVVTGILLQNGVLSPDRSWPVDPNREVHFR